MDAFLARPSFESVLGAEAMHLFRQSPQHWQDFIEAVREISIADFIEQSGNPYLMGLFNAVLDAFAGDEGFLGVHRLDCTGRCVPVAVSAKWAGPLP